MGTALKNDNALKVFERIINELKDAPPISKKQHVTKLLSTIEILADSQGGIGFLFERIDEMTEAGIFQETSWEDPSKLFPALAGGTLKADQANSIYEMLSELRVLAIGEGKMEVAGFTKTQAIEFLQEVVAQNLDIAFPDASEQQRESNQTLIDRAERLFHFILDKIPLEGVKEMLAKEIGDICAQRPIATERVREMIDLVKVKMPLDPEKHVDQDILIYVNAIHAPTELANIYSSLSTYIIELDKLSDEDIKQECIKLGKSLQKTGLASAYHTAMLHFLTLEHPVWSSYCLNLDATGKAELKKNRDFVQTLIAKAIKPSTCQSVYGLAMLLERSMLSRQPVMNGLRKILTLSIHKKVQENILKSHHSPVEVTANEILLADTLSVLGQPLGIGQGWNPTCQAARGISLWSQHAPGKLLNMIIDAARYNKLEFRFEGDLLNSEQLALGLAKKMDFKLDSVSIVLVPHLDRIYNEMMRRASFRNEDPHKWANPALYGHWIPTGFISAYNHGLNAITNYSHFVRLFYATHHPDYNEGHDLVYPNPVGLFITGPSGQFLGFHAVSLLRISQGPKEDMRIYFLNPNNEGRQKWAPDIRPTVSGNGEKPGESSLPFHQIASRIYAFHYNPAEIGDLELVDQKYVEEVVKLAKDSWGIAYNWVENSLLI